MKIFKAVFILGFYFANAFPAFPNSQKPPKIIAAFNKMSPGKNVCATAPHTDPPGHIYKDKEVLRDSPNGKYTARLIESDGEIADLTIYRRQAGSNHFRKKYAVSSEIVGVGGCLWVPHHRNWIVFSTSGAYGWGTIGLWTGSKQVRWLRCAKTGDEGFNVRGVSADGRTLIYEHFGSNSPDPHYKRKGRLYMILPRS